MSRRERDTPTTHLSSLFPKTFASSYGCRARSSLRNPLLLPPHFSVFSLFRLRCVSRGQVTTKCFLRYRLSPITTDQCCRSFSRAKFTYRSPSRRPSPSLPLSIGPEGGTRRKGRENANNVCLPTESNQGKMAGGRWSAVDVFRACQPR